MSENYPTWDKVQEELEEELEGRPDPWIWREAVTAAKGLQRGHGTDDDNAVIYAFIKKCKDEIAIVRAYEGSTA